MGNFKIKQKVKTPLVRVKSYSSLLYDGEEYRHQSQQMLTP